MADNPFFGLFDAVTSGLSSNKALEAYREAGGQISNETFRALYTSARSMLAQEAEEASRPLNRIPGRGEREIMPTRNATGVIQRIGIFVRDKGDRRNIRMIFQNVKSDRGMNRATAIANAVEDWALTADEYNEVVLGGVHLGAYDLEPGHDFG